MTLPPMLPLTYLQRYDAFLFDMDGTLMHGSVPIDGAAEGVAAVRHAGRAAGFATNNASRTPEQVVDHLRTVGVQADPSEVITSPQIAAQILADLLPSGATVMVVGGPSLAHEVRAVGLVPVFDDSDDVQGVVQGWSPDLNWARLAEGCYGIRRGLPWVATNVDATLPTERGFAPGNGSMVAALRHATGSSPVVAGKPEPAMFTQAARRLGSAHPIAVGDRLDTDIEGANRAGIDSLMVLTGVNTIEDALHADPIRRPTWIEADLLSLGRPAPEAVRGTDGSYRCGDAAAQWHAGDVVMTQEPTSMNAVRAALALITERCADIAWEGDLRVSARGSGEKHHRDAR